MPPRWEIAHFLNKVTGWCWVTLVGWAIDGDREDLQRARYDGRRCRVEADGCWCGKFQPPQSACPLRICNGSGYLPITDEGRSYDQECVCAPGRETRR